MLEGFCLVVHFLMKVLLCPLIQFIMQSLKSVGRREGGSQPNLKNLYFVSSEWWSKGIIINLIFIIILIKICFKIIVYTTFFLIQLIDLNFSEFYTFYGIEEGRGMGGGEGGRLMERKTEQHVERERWHSSAY